MLISTTNMTASAPSAVCVAVGTSFRKSHPPIPAEKGAAATAALTSVGDVLAVDQYSISFAAPPGNKAMNSPAQSVDQVITGAVHSTLASSAPAVPHPHKVRRIRCGGWVCPAVREARTLTALPRTLSHMSIIPLSTVVWCSPSLRPDALFSPGASAGS